jgi:hypothetical protein
MNPLVQLSRQVQHLFIALLFASFAVVQSAKAVDPKPNEDNLIGNVAAEDNAVADLATVAGNATLKGKETKPNHWVIKINFEKFIMCAMEKVRFQGDLEVSFQPGGNDNVVPNNVHLKGISAKGTSPKPLGRTYRLKDNKGKGTGRFKVRNENGFGNGSFGRKFEFVAEPNLPGKKVQFAVEFALSYEFKNGDNVFRLESRPPEIVCLE